jgi:hypothetical protein
MTATVIVSFLVGAAGFVLGVFNYRHNRRTLAWQQDRDRERTATRLVVEFEHATEPVPRPDGGGGFITDERCRSAYVLTLVAYNAGEAPEFISDLLVEEADGELGSHLEEFRPDRRVEPRERITRPVRVDDLRMRVEGGLIGRARLASGRTVDSEVAYLMPELLEDVEASQTDGDPRLA